MYNLIYHKKKGLFETFFENRSALIRQYENGDITKREFLEYNYDFVISMNVKPFLKVDSYEKGMFNYQYYNVIAKYFRMLSMEMKNSRKHQRQSAHYLNMGNNYYHEKDKAAIAVLKLIEFKGVESYYVKCESKFLKDKLYEIVLLDYKEAIFHSKAIWMLEILKAENVFSEKRRISIIDEYINATY